MFIGQWTMKTKVPRAHASHSVALTLGGQGKLRGTK